MAGMSSPRLLLALCLPLVLTACSSSDEPSARPSASASASPSAEATIPVATGYVVTARDGVSEQDLKDAVATLSKLHGVVKVSRIGERQIRVDLTMKKLPDDGAKIREELKKLGTVTVP